MKKLLAASGLLALSSLPAMATNGDNMIGVTPASEAMGGLGVGMPVGSIDSIFRNPAWMSTEKGFTVSFGGILFMPSVKGRVVQPVNTGSGMALYDTGYVSSRANFFTVPEVGITHRISDKVVAGIAAYGVSGMGVDYRNKDQMLANMHTTLQFMRIIPAISYQVNPNLSIGAGVDLAWGSLDLGAFLPNGSGGVYNAGGGQSSAYGVGARFGLSYDLGIFSAGLIYQSPVSMKYKYVFDSNNDGVFESLKLQQPMEIAAGAGFRVSPALRLGTDIRWIGWSKADGYKQFKWKDQVVFAVGGEYMATNQLKLRAGYNYAKSPIRSMNNLGTCMPGDPNPCNLNRIPDFAQPFPDYNVQWFNLIGFPAISEHHITFGGSYQFTKNFAVDVSYVHAFEKKVESTAMNGMVLAGAKNAQNSVGLSLRWSF